MAEEPAAVNANGENEAPGTKNLESTFGSTTSKRDKKVFTLPSGKPWPPPAEDGETLRVAATAGNLEKVVDLITSGCDINQRFMRRRTALHFAANYGRKEVVAFLLSKSAQPNATDFNERTPLHYAAQFGRDKETVSLLLKHPRCDVNALDDKGQSAIDVARGDGVAELIAEAGGTEGYR